MRTFTEVSARISVLIVNLWSETMLPQLGRTPTACRHHVWQPMDLRKEVGGAPNPRYNRIADAGQERVGLCLYAIDGQPSLELCEDVVDALRCRQFSPKMTPEEAYERFQKNLRDTAWVEKNAPELAALVWVAGTSPAKPASWLDRLFSFLSGVARHQPQMFEYTAEDFIPTLSELPLPKESPVVQA